jgi:DNA-binding NtrC family response regulator
MIGSAARHRLLVVDDSADTRELLQRNLSSQGYEVLTAGGVAEALDLLASVRVNLVITDLKMPGASGLELVRHVKETLKDTDVITITGYPSVESAVTAVKLGAEEYLTKPFTQDELFAAVRHAIDRAGGSAASDDRAAGPRAGRFGIVGTSDSMQRVMTSVTRAAAASTPVLLLGEYGTGRQLIARAIHCASARASAPFLALGCTGLSEQVLEKPGPGRSDAAAGGSIAGVFQLVERGTLFIGDVSDLPPGAQGSLLRALDDRSFRLVGASHRDLRPLVRAGAFREDLFVRLGIDTIVVPPLRDRSDDVLLLAEYFAARFASDAGLPAPGFSPEAATAMKEYSWPGNVAELRQLVEALVLANTGTIEVSDLPDYVRRGTRGGRPVATLRELEDEHIRTVLASVAGNKTRAAEILGINRKTLREKLREHSIASAGPVTDD